MLRVDEDELSHIAHGNVVIIPDPPLVTVTVHYVGVYPVGGGLTDPFL